MKWFPTVDYILELFKQVIGKPILMEAGKLQGTLDKARHGIPYHETPTTIEQATIIYREIVENHYFMDGNKRIGILVAAIFLEKNGLVFRPRKGEIFSMTMAVAGGKKDFDEIKAWFLENTTKTLP